MTTDPLIGQTLGAYRVTRLLKHTGMSMVYLARDDKLARDVVVKVMSPSHSDDDSFAARFQQEALATARLSHPNIIHIYDFGRHDDLYYMVMEYLPGGSLYERLVETATTGRRMGMAQALQIVGLMAQALDHAHRVGFVHRDVKPSNILFSQDGHPVLTDLGIVKTRESMHLTELQFSVGTPEYMSPEQGRGDPVDARSDLYSLGVVLYELLAGTLPFRAETTWGLIHKHLYEVPPPLQTFNRSVSPALRSVVEKALAKRPEDRIQTAREFAESLARAQAAPNRRVYAPPPPPLPPEADHVPPGLDAGKSRRGSRPVEARTDLVAIPGRPTPRAVPARRRPAAPWVLGIAGALLVAAVALVASGAVNLGGTPAPTAAPQAPTASVIAAVETATRMPATALPAPVRTAAPATTPRVTLAKAVSSVAQPVVVMVGADGGQVTLAPYIDPQGRYGLYLPEDWLRTADGLGDSFEAPDRMARILVHQVPDTKPGESPAEVAQRYVSGARALFQAVREIERAEVMVGDFPALEQQLEAEVLDVPVKVRLLAVNVNGAGLVAVAAAAAANEPGYRLLLTTVLDSFRVSGSLTPPQVQIASATPQSAQAPTIAPTFTLAPTVTRPSATATRPAARPSATAARANTPAATGSLPAPILLSPADNESVSDQVTFSWRWNGPALSPNQGFEVRIWKAGQPDHYGAAEPTNGNNLTINLLATYGVAQGGAGSYFWTVAVVQRSPYQRIGPEAALLRLQIGGGGGGGGSTQPTRTPPPP